MIAFIFTIGNLLARVRCSRFPVVLSLLFEGWAPQPVVDATTSMSFLTHFQDRIYSRA